MFPSLTCILFTHMYRIPVENYDMFCKSIKKINTLVVDKEEIQIAIGQTRKSLGEKDAQNNSKQTPCWTPIKLTDDYTRELLEAKAKHNESDGQQRLDD